MIKFTSIFQNFFPIINNDLNIEIKLHQYTHITYMFVFIFFLLQSCLIQKRISKCRRDLEEIRND